MIAQRVRGLGEEAARVAAGERRFERRLVSATPDGPGRLRVTRGLRTGDRIVSDGVLLLKSRQEQQQQN